MKNMKPKSQVQKRIDGMSGTGNYTAGTGIEISGNEIKLKTAGKGVSIFDVDQALGGVYIGYKQGLEVDYDGRLSLDNATTVLKGGIKIGNGLLAASWDGKCSLNLGKGMRFNSYNDYNYG
ncbi:MAG: hypothetical protein K2N29_00320, partial [Ruminiclostridium sp.]|nr:hypothetical protein [Ruminiclostridium sp.]